MSKAAIFTLHYLPSVAYVSKLLSAEVFLIEKHDNFQKASFRNRTFINTANGTMLLSIPVIGGRDKHQQYADTQISYAENWQKRHWQSIRSAYGSAPFFEYYADYIAPFYGKRFDFLFDFNLALLEKTLALLKQKRTISLTQDFQHSYSEAADCRNDDFIQSGKSVKRYIQPFSEKYGFNPNVSVIDLLLCEGTNATSILL